MNIKIISIYEGKKRIRTDVTNNVLILRKDLGIKGQGGHNFQDKRMVRMEHN